MGNKPGTDHHHNNHNNNYNNNHNNQNHNNHNNNNNTGMDRFGTKVLMDALPNKVQVRQLPPYIKGGTKMYMRNKKLIKNKLGSKNTWINDISYFQNLHKISYSPFNEVNLRIKDKIDDYLLSLSRKYSRINEHSSKVLNQKLEEFYQDWIQKHGSIPTLPSQVKRRKTNNETETNGNNKYVKTKKEELSQKEQMELEYQTALKREYDSKIRDIHEEHIPTVYSPPGNPNFSYLTNSIKMVYSKRTICFSMDVEAFEFNNDIITEIGISIFDPRENQDSLSPMTRNYHLIVSEVLGIRNRKFICDFKDCFLLGESIVLDIDQCVEFIQSLINYYMIANTEEDKTWYRAFVGHNIKGDINWLKDIGIKVPGGLDNLDYSLAKYEKSIINEENNRDKVQNQTNKNTLQPIFVLDTEKFYRFCYGCKGGNLGRMLRLFGIPHAYLHNAGNDAYYTLRLLLHLCDINYRTHQQLDDLNMMAHRIRNWIAREKFEPKILPMSYTISVVEATNATNKVAAAQMEKARKKRKKDLVSQTEFSGSRWFGLAKDAFLSTLE